MHFNVTDRKPVAIDTDCLIAAIGQGESVAEVLGDLDEAVNGLLSRLDENGELPRSAGKSLMLHAPHGLGAGRLLLVGLGKPEKFNEQVYVRAAHTAGKALRASHARSAHCLLPDRALAGRDPAWKSLRAALALDYADYVYSTTRKPDDDASPSTDSVSFPAGDGVDEALAQAAAIAAGIRRCRELGNLPPNTCTPIYLAEQALELARDIPGLEAEILDENQLAELGMESLLAVARGSANPPRMIHLKWRGGPEGQAPYALVGKGVTFDTGGISLKPREHMEQMKFDMCGAAATFGVLEAVAKLELPINVDGVVAAVENMPDGKAYRPGDVITTLSGKTVEVLNTDAEGRMILADALTWTARMAPAAMVDIATLTGACVVALGHHASAVMSHDDELAGELLAAGINSTDRAWRLPLWDDYQEQLKTPFADMKNIGGMAAGAITAGCFLARYAEDRRWAHLDIAGSAWKWGEAESATGRPVALLVEWLCDRAAS